jgi:hypothetical protein
MEPALPKHPTTPLASGQINHDQLAVELVEPDNHPPVVRINWPAAASIATPANYPAIAAAVTKIIAESATALARWKAHGR